MSPRAMLIGVLCAVAIAGGAVFAGCGEDPQPRKPSAVELLSVNQLVGQRIVAGFTGSKPPKKLLNAVRAGEVGGVILFAENTPSKKTTQRNTLKLQRAARLGKQPYLLILTDQEGGDIRRLAWAPPKKTAAEMGDTKDPEQTAHSAGTLAGSALRQVGVNVDLAPVADVANQAVPISTPVAAPVTGTTGQVTGPTSSTLPSDVSFLGTRTFSGNPRVVAKSACAFATGLQNAGVAATFKHFPGLGRAPSNTDFGAVEVSASTRAIKSDLRPYKQCPETPKLVMVSSAKYPSLGIKKAAALMPQTYELLEKTGFKGLTITDAFDTPAIKEYEHAAGRALIAGVDLLLYGQVTHHATDAYAELLAQAQAKQFSKSDLQAAAAKILALKQQLKTGAWAP